MKAFELFVPGRVCLFGEHSDWAGGHRRTNSELVPGVVIISGTNQGLYARCRPAAGELVIRSRLEDGTYSETWRAPMVLEHLQAEAAAGGFFSYAAGVAAYMLDFYGVGGLEIDNFKTTLPVKKGLSSSAAFCVLVARAFNQAYQLGLTTRAEIEAAYQGEIATPSRCGRMDQGCAYGQIPVMMTFDGDRLGVQPLRPGGEFNLLIADLGGQKDTVRILADLNDAYPFADSPQDRAVQHYLGAENRRLVQAARTALEVGDAVRLGALMSEAQARFDAALMPVCSELRSPLLHRVLADPQLKQWVHGGKGVGSQGDGSVQFVCHSARARQALIAYLKHTYAMSCFELDIKPTISVRKAVIPVAGLGTRMYPYTKAVPKTFLPVITPDGMAKPVIQVIIEEALSAGIEEVALIIQPDDEARFREYFQTDTRPDTLAKLPPALAAQARHLAHLGRSLTFICQDEPGGFGQAVLLAERWVGQEPFMLLLGDHLFRSHETRSVAHQVLEAFQVFGDTQSVVGIYAEELARVKHYGTVAGEWVDDTILQLTRLTEKPTEDQARTFLAMERRGQTHFYCVNGLYVLRPRIFALLARQTRDAANEIQLTAALEALRQEEGVKGLVVNGTHYDTGLPHIYAATIADFATP